MIMNPKRSLFLKILLWFLMSLVLLIGGWWRGFSTWIFDFGQNPP